VTITDLVPSLSLDTFLAQRDAMVERAHRARKLLQEAQAIADAMPTIPSATSHFWLSLYTEPLRFDFAEDRGFDTYVKAIDAACWARLLDLSGLRTFMDATARRKWDESIADRKVPPLTLENVEATFGAMHASRRDMFERGVIAVFKALSWDYRTNNPVRFGKRIILKYVFDVRIGTVNYEGANRLDDLVRALSILDGKPEPDHRQGAYRRLSERRALPCVADFGYFTVKGFKNGNGHLTFVCPELVDQMNAIIGRHFPGALPPAREAA
jgi:hypothetical protein